MAVGNTLGLLIKVAIDAAVAGAKKELDDFFKSTEEGAKRVTESSKGLTTGFNQASNAVRELSSGQVGAGVTNLGKSFLALGPGIGTVVVGLGAAALAGYGAVKSFQAITSSAAEFGTRSRDAFEELQKNATAAGTPITDLQRNLSAGIVGALDRVKGASDGFMAKVIEESGPALIVLLNQITKLLVDLQPLARVAGQVLSVGFLYGAGAVKAMDDELRLLTTDLKTLFVALAGGPVLFTAFLIKGFNEAKAAMKDLVVPTAGFDPEKTKKAAKDLTDAQLEVNKAARELTLEREKAAVLEAEINRELKAGAITADEALGRRLAILANIRIAEEKVFDAEQKRIDADVKGQNRRTDAFEENANKREIAAKKGAEAEIAAATQQDKDQTKFAEARLKQLDEILKREKDLNAIIQERARISPPGAPLAIEGQVPGIEPEVKLPKPVGGFFEDLKKSLGESTDSFKTWGDLVGGILGQFAQASQQAFAAFILTGKLGGQIFKQLVAQIIAAVAIESAVKAIFQLAEGFAALAAGNPVAAAEHFASAKTYAVVAAVAGAAGVAIGAAGGLGGGAAGEAAGAGGFGGSSAAPTPVTINQGAGGPLGIQMQQLNALNNISNKLDTASPGDVVTRGAEQNPVAIGQANNEASRRDGSISREFLQISGLRTA